MKGGGGLSKPMINNEINDIFVNKTIMQDQ